MTPDRRKQELRVLPDGSVWDEEAARMWLAQMNPAPRVTVVRLSIPPMPRPSADALPGVHQPTIREPEQRQLAREAARRGAPGTLPTDLSAPPSASATRPSAQASVTSRAPFTGTPSSAPSAGRRSTVGGR